MGFILVFYLLFFVIFIINYVIRNGDFMGRFKEFLESKKIFILYGVLGIEFESRGCDVFGKFWLVKYLIEDLVVI